MDADRSGDIDEMEWVNNLKKLPLLYKVLEADIDPDWGTLKCYLWIGFSRYLRRPYRYTGIPVTV